MYTHIHIYTRARLSARWRIRFRSSPRRFGARRHSATSAEGKSSATRGDVYVCMYI